MAGSAVWAYVVSGAVAVSGVGAAVIATRGDDAAAATAHVWIDAPADSSVLAPGTVTVQAHAAGTSFDSLVLSVDGTEVATDEPEVDGSLAYATFEWQATPGSHELIVRDGDTASAPRFLTVVDPADVDPDDSTPVETSTTVAESTTTVADASTTTVADSTTTTVGSTSPATVTVAPTTTAPVVTSPPTPSITTSTSTTTTTTLPPAVSVGIPTVTPIELERCKGGSSTVTITASVANVAGATVRLTGPGADTSATMSVSGGTATVVIDMAPYSNADTFTVVVTAVGPGGSATSAPRTFTTICSIG